MTFLEKYLSESTWHGKVTVMEIFHLAQSIRNKGWTVTKTAQSFQVSPALVSENLKLATAIHINESLLQCASRQEALKKINGTNMETQRQRDLDELD